MAKKKLDSDAMLKIVKKALTDWKKTRSFEDARSVTMWAAIAAQATVKSAKSEELITLIDEFGAKAMKANSVKLQEFFGVLGATLIDSLLTKKANWLFDMAPGPMFNETKKRLQGLSVEERKKALDALRQIINHEQEIGRQSPEKAELVRRVIKQVEEALEGK